MKWQGSNLRVDLMTKTDYQMASDHSPSNRRSRCSCCRKGLLLKILLLVILVLLTQIAIMYLQIQSMKAWSEVLTKKMEDTTELIDVIKHNEGTAEELPPLRDDGEKTKIVIYSYTGIEELPSGDMIQDILSQHPDVFFLHQPTKLLNSSSVQRTSSDAERQEMITNLLSCDSQLLGRLKQIMFRDIHKPALRRRHTGCRSPHDCRHLDLRKRCKAAPVSVIDVYKDYTSDLGLKDIFSLNDSVKFVHIVADPRQVTYSLWLQQREDSDRERIAITKDNQLIANIASDYCDGLMSDIRAVKKMKSHPEGVRELPLLYHFIRYEDYINNTMAEMMELFNYLQMHLTEEMKDNMESAEQKIEVL